MFACRTLELELRTAVFAASGRFDVATQRVRDPLHTVTNYQHGNTLRKNCRGTLWSVRVVHGTGTAGEDDAGGLVLANFFHGRRARKNGAKDFLLAYSACDELRVLAAKIEHHDAAALGLRLQVFFLQFRSGGHGGLRGHVV